MRLIKKMLKMKAVYWEPSGTKDQFSNPIYLPPVDIKCRWEDIKEQFLDEQGKEVVADSTVYADRDLIEGGLLMLGEVQDLSEALPPPSKLARRIRRFEKFGDLKCREFVRIAYL